MRWYRNTVKQSNQIAVVCHNIIILPCDHNLIEIYWQTCRSKLNTQQLYKFRHICICIRTHSSFILRIARVFIHWIYRQRSFVRSVVGTGGRHLPKLIQFVLIRPSQSSLKHNPTTTAIAKCLLSSAATRNYSKKTH